MPKPDTQGPIPQEVLEELEEAESKYIRYLELSRITDLSLPRHEDRTPARTTSTLRRTEHHTLIDI